MRQPYPQATLPGTNPLMGPYAMFGVAPAPVQPTTTAPIPGVERSAGPGLFNAMGPAWKPDNPMFWVAAALAVTFGLIAGATEFRVGSARAGIAIGK